jgi:hypothetical protein
MKKTCLLPIFFALSLSLSAQIKKGSVLLGTDISFIGYNDKEENNNLSGKHTGSNFNISVLAGKAVKDNLFVGLSLIFSSSTTKDMAIGSTQSTDRMIKSYGGSVWMRKYFPVARSFYAFVDGGIGASFGNEQRSGSNAQMKNFGISLNLYPGLSYQITKSIYLDAAISNLANIYYSHSESEEEVSAGNIVKVGHNHYGISTSLANSSNPLQLGFRWIIPSKG